MSEVSYPQQTLNSALACGTYTELENAGKKFALVTLFL